jgi:hypothetical protein
MRENYPPSSTGNIVKDNTAFTSKFFNNFTLGKGKAAPKRGTKHISHTPH